MHWRNSHFQLRWFLAGRCHTADEAYRLLLELREERVRALEQANIGRLTAAWWLRSVAWLRWLPWVGARIRLMLMAHATEVPRLTEMVRVAEEELAAIDRLIDEIRPHRVYGHLPDREAHQAAQRAEWRAELEFRAENFLVAEGRIPADQLATMRQHPDFAASIWPHICEISALLQREPRERLGMHLVSKQLTRGPAGWLAPAAAAMDAQGVEP